VRARVLRAGDTIADVPDVVFGDDAPGAVLMLEILGRVLSLLRRRYRISQQEMARRLHWPQSVVSKVENGEVHLTVEQLDDWVTVVDLVGAKVRGRSFAGVRPAIVFDIADEISEALDEDGYDVRWGTGRLYDGALPLVRGVELEDLMLERWPEEHRELL
jgi:transcriptional regulator with XRE-family HTH domain